MKRQVIEIPGVTHGKAPIPMGAKIGNIVYSSGLMGKDPATDKLPSAPEDEIKFLFQNVSAFMEQAGGSPDDIIRMTVFLKSNDLREAFNVQWLNMFPDHDNRPARHITLVDLPGGMNVQVEVIAVL